MNEQAQANSILTYTVDLSKWNSIGDTVKILPPDVPPPSQVDMLSGLNPFAQSNGTISNNFAATIANLNFFLSSSIAGATSSAIKTSITIDNAGDSFKFSYSFNASRTSVADFAFLTVNGSYVQFATTPQATDPSVAPVFFSGSKNGAYTYTFNTPGTYTIGLGVVSASPINFGSGLGLAGAQVEMALVASRGFLNFPSYNQLQQLNSGTEIPYTPVEVNGLQIPLLFDESYYDWKNPDIKAAVRNGQFKSGYDHFIQYGQFESGRNPSTLYNEQYYLSNNPDVAQAVQRGEFKNGLQHFLLYGNKEERSPSMLFNQQDYLTGNPDVQAAVAAGAFTSALDHYIEFGASEGRSPELALFQEAFYLQQNPDVKAAVQSGLFANGYQHYLRFGAREGRNHSRIFNESAYRSLNPDVASAISSASIINGFDHYILFGREEGRPTANVI